MIDASKTQMQDLVGRTVNGRYVLRDLLGSGAFGGVFLTEQYVLGRRLRDVACKITCATQVTEETAVELFADVLQLAGAMERMTDAEARNHLVHVYDGGIAAELDGRAFLVMEYVPGRSLASEFHRHGRVPYRLVLKWARQICVALRGLHHQTPPLLHRDLKPENVLLGADGTIRLIDFGLAARMLASGHVPGTAGTHRYMAPETAAGGSIPASDLYSLGLLMYEGVTGRYAFEHIVAPADLPFAIYPEWFEQAKLASPPPRPSTIVGSLSRSVDELIMKCIEVKPANRFADADDVIRAIDALHSGTVRTLPGEAELEQIRRLRADDVAGESVSIAERVLREPQLETRIRYALLRELAEVHDSLGAHPEAARRFGEACELLGRLSVARTERCDLLARTEQAFRRAGNAFQAERFARRRRDECGGR